jgi:hypothetical protein
VIIAALFLPSAGAKAQPDVPILQVDTLVDLGKVIKGEASGAFFLPDGNIIAVIRDTPLIVDSKSGLVLRRLDSLIGQYVQRPKVSPDGRYLIAYSWKGTAIWDIATGKILKYFENVNDYSFSPNGTDLYICGGNSSELGAIRVIDMNTLEEIERFGYFPSGFLIDISTDGQTLALSIYKKPDESSDKRTNSFILINLNDKEKYTLIEAFEPGVNSMEFSPDGNQVSFLYNGSDDLYIYIYNLETKEKKYIRKAELSVLFGGVYIAGIGIPQFITNEIIYTTIGDLKGSYLYNFTWNIPEHRVKNYINFNTSTIDVKDSLVLFGGGRLIGLTNKYALPVKDLDVPKDAYLTYKNNQLEYNSERVFLGESTIYDTTGKMIADLGSQPYVIGKNIIRINQPLPIGIYILTIKDNTSQSSYKFIVE